MEQTEKPPVSAKPELFETTFETKPVTVDVFTTEGEVRVMENLRRKAAQVDQMFASLVEHMGDAMGIDRSQKFTTEEETPS